MSEGYQQAQYQKQQEAQRQQDLLEQQRLQSQQAQNVTQQNQLEQQRTEPTTDATQRYGKVSQSLAKIYDQRLNDTIKTYDQAILTQQKIVDSAIGKDFDPKQMSAAVDNLNRLKAERIKLESAKGNIQLYKAQANLMASGQKSPVEYVKNPIGDEKWRVTVDGETYTFTSKYDAEIFASKNVKYTVTYTEDGEKKTFTFSTIQDANNFISDKNRSGVNVNLTIKPYKTYVDAPGMESYAESLKIPITQSGIPSQGIVDAKIDEVGAAIRRFGKDLEKSAAETKMRGVDIFAGAEAGAAIAIGAVSLVYDVYTAPINLNSKEYFNALDKFGSNPLFATGYVGAAVGLLIESSASILKLQPASGNVAKDVINPLGSDLYLAPTKYSGKFPDGYGSLLKMPLKYGEYPSLVNADTLAELSKTSKLAGYYDAEAILAKTPSYGSILRGQLKYGEYPSLAKLKTVEDINVKLADYVYVDSELYYPGYTLVKVKDADGMYRLYLQTGADLIEVPQENILTRNYVTKIPQSSYFSLDDYNRILEDLRSSSDTIKIEGFKPYSLDDWNRAVDEIVSTKKAISPLYVSVPKSSMISISAQLNETLTDTIPVVEPISTQLQDIATLTDVAAIEVADSTVVLQEIAKLDNSDYVSASEPISVLPEPIEENPFVEPPIPPEESRSGKPEPPSEEEDTKILGLDVKDKKKSVSSRGELPISRFRVVLDGRVSTIEASGFVEALSRVSRGRGSRATVTRL